MQLTHLTKVTKPLTAIAITGGRADTLYAQLSGNKYASFGQMNFHYHNLRVRLLNKEDSLKRSLLLTGNAVGKRIDQIKKSKTGADVFYQGQGEVCVQLLGKNTFQRFCYQCRSEK